MLRIEISTRKLMKKELNPFVNKKAELAFENAHIGIK